jgi:hypothetical protein
MQQIQNFVIKPNGKVQGGRASYQVDSVSGEILFSAEITVKVFFIKRTEKQTGKYVVDPRLLKPSALAKLDDQVKLGAVTFKVQDVDSVTAKVGVIIDGQDIRGYAVVDRQGEIIKVTRLFAEGKVGPLSLTVEALEEKPGAQYPPAKVGWLQSLREFWETL